MKISVGNESHGYYVIINIDRSEFFPQRIPGRKLIIDDPISEILNFSSVDEYQNLGVKYGGFLFNDGLFFHNKKDVNTFINSDEFTSHVVMAKLKS